MNIDKSNYKIVLNDEHWVERQIDDTGLFLSIEAWLLKEINEYGCLSNKSGPRKQVRGIKVYNIGWRKKNIYTSGKGV
jgi:hypothetical protein